MVFPVYAGPAAASKRGEAAIKRIWRAGSLGQDMAGRKPGHDPELPAFAPPRRPSKNREGGAEASC